MADDGLFDPNALDPAARQRGLIVLLAATFLTWGGFFLVVPLIAVHYVDGLGWAAGSIGLALAIRQFLQQGSTALCGAVADRLGAKGLIWAGMLIRSVSFVILAYAESFKMLIIAVLVMGLGGGLFESPKAAAIAALTDESNRRRFYSLAGVIGGLGVALGTQAGALLIKTDFKAVSLVAAAVFFISFVLIVILLPPVRVATERGGFADGLGRALRDRPFVTYAALLAAYWFMATQFNLSLTLRATAVAGTEAAVSWIYAINSGATILLGYPLPRFLERRIAALPMLIVGIGLTALGMAAVGFAGNVPLLLGAVLIISLGTVLTRPGEQTVTAGLADPAARGSYFGVASLSLAIGGGLGNVAGGVVYDRGEAAGRPELPWLLFAAAGTIAAVGLWRLHRSKAVARPKFERSRLDASTESGESATIR